MNDFEIIRTNHLVRKTRKQKDAFIDWVLGEFPNAKVETGGMLNSRNVVIGDVRRARTVISAHYDTCAELPFPNLIMPKNFILTLLWSLLICLPFFAFVLGAEWLAGFLTNSATLAYLVRIVALCLVFWLILSGWANPNTFNDNTSGVVTVLRLAKRCRDEGIGDVAFVLFDHEETGLFGSSFFRSHHKKEMLNTLLINLDCISDGDDVMVVVNRRARKLHGDLFEKSFLATEKKRVRFDSAGLTFYPSDQMGFRLNIAICALKKKWGVLYLDRIHTRRDTAWDEENLALVENGILSFLKTTENEPKANA